MKNFLCILCFLCGFHSALALDRNAFTFTNYDLKVQVTPSTRSLEAQGRITLRNDTTQPQRNPVLQISSTLQWHSITISGKPVEYLSESYRSDIDHTGALSEAVITLPTPIPPQASVGLEVSYSGKVSLDTTRLTRIGVPAEIAANSDWDHISESFTAVRGIGYVAWYPIATEAASLSEGSHVFQTTNAWKFRESHSVMRILLCQLGSERQIVNCRNVDYERLAAIVPSFILGEFQTLTQPPFNIQYITGHESSARLWAAAGERAAPFIAQWFGARKRAMQIVELPDKNMHPFEAGDLFFTPLVSGNEKDIQVVMAHQLAHASFYSPRPWIDEGLAHFAQALEREQQDGRKAALAYMDDRLAPLQQAEKQFVNAKQSGPPPQGQPLVSATDEVFFRTKAMFVWWMLRDIAGDDALGRAIRLYRADQDKEPSYFQRLLAHEFHRDLEWFFDDWLYRDRGLPQFRVIAVYPRKLIPQDWSVTVTVENSGRAGAEVPVVVRAAQGEERKRLELHAREKGVVRIPIPATPQQAIVNDGSVPEFDMSNNVADIKTSESAQ
jgi:hypothetical protein